MVSPNQPLKSFVPDLRDLAQFSPEALIRTGYVSRAYEPMGKDDLDSIEDSSRRNNESLEVGGILITNQMKIFQVLEGPASSVRELLIRIASDSRHHSMKIFAVTPVQERLFEHWRMAVRSMAQETPQRREVFDGIFGVFEEARIPLALDEKRVAFFRGLGE